MEKVMRFSKIYFLLILISFTILICCKQRQIILNHTKSTPIENNSASIESIAFSLSDEPPPIQKVLEFPANEVKNLSILQKTSFFSSLVLVAARSPLKKLITELLHKLRINSDRNYSEVIS